MKRTFTLTTLLFLACFQLHAQIIFQEDFESGSIPADWAIQTAATDGGWKVGSPAALSSQFFSIAENGSSNIAATNDDACNCNKSNEYFITPAIDLSGQTAVVLSFDAYFLDNSYQGNQEDATIEVSTDGINWTVLEDLHGHGSWDKHTIDLSAFAGLGSVYIGFRYDDGQGWLYGLGIDNVVVEVPPTLDARMVETSSSIYGEVDRELPIKGVIYNEGITTINEIEISYSINGNTPITESLNGLNIPSFNYYEFEAPSPWIPNAAGVYDIDISIITVNTTPDENPNNNSEAFETEIFELVIAPNKIDDFLASPPVLVQVASAAQQLNKPTDLDFFPILGKNELWVINQRTANSGGSTVTIANATEEPPSDFNHLVDGNAWHFMSLPTGIAFSDDNFNFASSPGVQDANHNGGTFTGPTLWSSHPDIYAQPSGGNGSHLDMLHGSPFSMGIAHEIDNAFWVYDDWNKDIVRYDFVDDHGPGNDDHSDAIVRRFQNIGIDADGDIPNHMVMDKENGWLYFIDNGNDRVIRLDINSGTGTSPIPLINEELAEHSRVLGFTYDVIIETGLDQPCGIELFKNRLLVSDYANGEIIIYDRDNAYAEMGRIETLEPGITGIKIGPLGNIWYTNRLQNSLTSIQPGEPLSNNDLIDHSRLSISPNPTSGTFWLSITGVSFFDPVQVQVVDVNGKEILSLSDAENNQFLDLSKHANGVYFIHVKGNDFYGTQRLILNK